MLILREGAVEDATHESFEATGVSHESVVVEVEGASQESALSLEVVAGIDEGSTSVAVDVMGADHESDDSVGAGAEVEEAVIWAQEGAEEMGAVVVVVALSVAAGHSLASASLRYLSPPLCARGAPLVDPPRPPRVASIFTKDIPL